jgi:hypothetical protein
MVDRTALLTDRRVLTDCVAALRNLRTVLFQCGDGELGVLAGDLAQLRALAGAGLVGAMAQAGSSHDGQRNCLHHRGFRVRPHPESFGGTGRSAMDCRTLRLAWLTW